MMPETKILYAFTEDEEPERKVAKENYKKIKKKMQDLYKQNKKNPVHISFEDMLAELELPEAEYYKAVRSKLKSAKIFLSRGSTEVGINAYNVDILHMFEANMDIQYVLDQYAVAAYCAKYMLKVDSGLSKLLRQAVAESDAGNMNLRERFRKVSNAFINGLLLSSQEAVYLALSLPLSRSSRDVVFINTGPK